MQKLILVARREFRQRISSRGFIIGSFAVPLILILVWAFTANMQNDQPGEPLLEQDASGAEEIAIGYVDHAQLIQDPSDLEAPLLFRSFADQDAATAALQRGEIEAFYVIAADYRQTGNVSRVSQELPSLPPATATFDQLLLVNLLASTGTDQASRLQQPFNAADLQFVSLQESAVGEAPSNPMLPFLVSIIIMIPLFTSGAYLLQSVTQEKSSRIMEILLASLRPWHILAGKLLGLGALTLVQYLIWATIAGLGLVIIGQELPNVLTGINLSLVELLLIVPFALGGYVLYAGLMAGIGALSPDLEGSRGWVFFITLPMMIPIYLWVAIVNFPNGPLAVTLSMIPFSAPVAMLMRMTSTVVPLWQLLASLILLLLTAVGMVWLMARLFRVQILLSGESPSLRRFVAAITA
jgi:ABC-2 type transport system permease protein